jgi:hypothetical protein
MQRDCPHELLDLAPGLVDRVLRDAQALDEALSCPQESLVPLGA